MSAKQYWLVTIRKERVASGGYIVETVYSYATDKHPAESLACNQLLDEQSEYALLFAIPISLKQFKAMNG